MASDEKRSGEKCVLAFFGIDRNLSITSDSISKRILHPASVYYDVESVGFLWTPGRIDNPRSGEYIDLPPPQISLLPCGTYKTSPPPNLSNDDQFANLLKYGDIWNDQNKSLQNLYMQLVSLSHVTSMAIRAEATVVVFLRPDLIYHDSFSACLKMSSSLTNSCVLLPHWQPHSGFNDRFAICRGLDAIKSYGYRLEKALEFCRSTESPLHAERLLKYALAGKNVRLIDIKASRVRANGIIRTEDFSYMGWKPSLRRFAGRIRKSILGG